MLYQKWLENWVNWRSWVLNKLFNPFQLRQFSIFFCEFFWIDPWGSRTHCWTASQPYRLSHVNALHINEFYYLKDQSKKISQKNIENWPSWKGLNNLFTTQVFALRFDLRSDTVKHRFSIVRVVSSGPCLPNNFFLTWVLVFLTCGVQVHTSVYNSGCLKISTFIWNSDL